MILGRFFLIAAALVLSACARPRGTSTFIDVVWKVASSTAAAPGTLYVFLSDGTLVITRPGDQPMTGKWTSGDGGITMIEEGISYRTDVLDVTPRALHIRSHNPGDPVDIHLVRADTPE